MNAITFLTRTGQTCTQLRQEFILLSDVMGVSALVDSLNNPPVAGGTESSVLGPFLTEDAPDGTRMLRETIFRGSDMIIVPHGESIASEGKGDYMYVEGRVLSTEGKPIANASLETWETDSLGGYSIIAPITQYHSTFAGYYDTQYKDRGQPDCRGRLVTDNDGRFGYRAVVPVAYPVPGDVCCLLLIILFSDAEIVQGPVGELLLSLGRHNMRPSHLHMMVEAPGYQKLITALYPEGDQWLSSDAVFGVKKSLIVVRLEFQFFFHPALNFFSIWKKLMMRLRLKSEVFPKAPRSSF
jgi:protocatechuate 3,4-dioxygenase beta subunit